MHGNTTRTIDDMPTKKVYQVGVLAGLCHRYIYKVKKFNAVAYDWFLGFFLINKDTKSNTLIKKCVI